MTGAAHFGPQRASAYRLERCRKGAPQQRWLLLAGGTAYSAASAWVSFRVGAGAGFAWASLSLLAVMFALWSLTYLEGFKARFETIPVLFALFFGGHIVMGAAAAASGADVRFGFLFSVLAFFLALLAPTLRSALAALGTAALVAVAGALMYIPAQNADFGGLEPFIYELPALALAALAAAGLEASRKETFDLRSELERRATSDDLTGVSNRAHINLLAQNEFARARRYREPYSCLIIEIDAYEGIGATWGARATDVVVQVFTGYCVVVMRHCDSFGRLGSHRFLALLPETQGPGALTLSNRMCSDLAGLDVMVDGNKLNFTVSIGAAELHQSDRWAGDLLRRAEQGLEDAIERGRGVAVFAAPPAPMQYDEGDAPAAEPGRPAAS